MVGRIEERLLERADVEGVHWLVGVSFPSVYYNLSMNQDRASHYAQAVIDATSSKAVQRMIPEIQRTLDAEVGAEATAIRDDARRVELVAKANSAAVQRDLAPFLAEGTWQPGDFERNVRFDRTPMSWSKIQSDGALSPDLNGLQRLLEIANAQGCFPRGGQSRGYYRNREHLDAHRPKWGYPQYWKNLSEDQIQEVRRIQALLIELGPTLVEEGMLAK